MFHLLPETEKKKLRKEYNGRLIVVTLIFLAISLVIGSVFLFPSYIISAKKLESIKTQNKTITERIQSKTDPRTADFLASLGSNLAVLNSTSSSASSSVYIKDITDKKIDGISINQFSLTRGSNLTIFIGGIADNRDDLTNFYHDLQSVSDFSSVNLPISDFAKKTDIDFNISITVKDK